MKITPSDEKLSISETRKPGDVKLRRLESPVWSRQVGEPEDRYNAFILYRDTPVENKRAAAQIARRVDKSERTVQLWAKEYRWDERVLAYDRYLDGQRMRQISRGRVAMYERHSQVAQAMQNLVIERLRSMDSSELTARDLREWMDVATKIELRARGESTDNVSLTIQDGREQAVERARNFYKEMTVQSPELTDVEKAQIIFESFDVQPHEIGLEPNILELSE